MQGMISWLRSEGTEPWMDLATFSPFLYGATFNILLSGIEDQLADSGNVAFQTRFS